MILLSRLMASNCRQTDINMLHSRIVTKHSCDVSSILFHSVDALFGVHRLAAKT